jgi:hypothetical protein
MDRSIVRWAGIAGLVGFVLLAVVNLIPGQPPAADASVEKIREYFVDNRDMLLVASMLQLLTLPLIGFFIVTVHGLLREKDTSPFPTLAMAATFVLGGLALAGGAVFSAVVWREGFAEAASADVVQLTWNAGYLLYGAGAAAFLTLMGSFAISAFRGNTFPAWSAWVGAGAAVVSLVGFLSPLGADLGVLGFVSFLAFGVWLAATSIEMLMMANQAEPGGT